MATTRRRGSRGAALVELALIVSVLALLSIGTVDVARAYRLNVRLENAAREAAGFGQITPNQVTCAGANNDIKDRARIEDPSLFGHAGYDVAVARETGATFTDYDVCEPSDGMTPVSPGDRVRVNVSAEFDVLTPFLSSIIGDPIEMTGSAIVVAQG